MAETDEPKTEGPPREGSSQSSPGDAQQKWRVGTDDVAPTSGDHPFPIVGLGGSAGSLSALQTFFELVPIDSGMAFVVVVHLLPEHESSLAEILQRSTSLPVVQVLETIEVKPNRVYVGPPGKRLSAMRGQLQVSEMPHEQGVRIAVDLFLRTLADSQGSRAVGIILSGADGDGAIGLKRIKELGGLTIAQDPDEAEHEGMPRAAIATGMVDWVLPVAEMPKRLAEYCRNEGRVHLPSEHGPQLARPAPSPVSEDDDAAEVALRETLNFLRARTGRDFSYYKRATILRRISWRMQVNGLATLPDYLAFLRMQQVEVSALLQDLLISVTNFFRDDDAFQALKNEIPSLFKGKTAADQVRVWVAGCATGEEAYSIAMLLCEHASTLDSPPSLQVFATDLDESAIRTAREGVYGESVNVDISGERLRRFFSKDHGRYRVRKEVREIVLFAVHDLLKDSPFSRIDLIACRNLLIYVTREAQAHAFDIFHFALRQDGLLFLGTSESADDASSLFSPRDKKYRLYTRRPAYRPALPLPSGPLSVALAVNPRYSSTMLVPLAGPSDNVASRSPNPEALLPERPTVARSFSWGELHLKLIERFAPPSVLVDRDHNIVHLSEHAGRFLQFGGGEPTINLLRLVHPSLRIELRSLLFHAEKEKEPMEARGVPVEIGGTRREVNIRVRPALDLGPELLLVIFDEGEAVPSQRAPQRPTQEGLMTQQLEHEVDHLKEQLRDTVEQYEASTEELKASNEELQAMNEELRSASEELETSREELQSINEELTTVNQELKSKVEELSHTNSDLQNLMGSTNIATVFLDRELRIKRYTPSAVPLFNLIPTDVGRPLSDLRHRLKYDSIAADAEKVLERLGAIQREVDSSDGKWFLAGLLPYRTLEDRIDGVVLTFVDITDRKLAEGTLARSRKELEGVLEQARRSHEQAQAAARTKDNFLSALSHELRASLAPVVQAAESLLQGKGLTQRQRNDLGIIHRNVQLETECIDDSLDWIHADQGRLELRRENFDLHEAIRAGTRGSDPDLKRKRQKLNIELDARKSEVYGDVARLERVFNDLLKNASRFTPNDGQIQLITRNNPGHIIVEVSDNGDGIEPAALSGVFEPFRQVNPSTSGEPGGCGLGLAIARAVVEAHEGTLTASSLGSGLGSTFVVRLLLADAPGY